MMRILTASGSYYARPVNGHLGVPRPFPGSTASSNNSSRNDSPSPTSSNDDSGVHAKGPFSSGGGLSRPSKFTSSLPGAAAKSDASALAAAASSSPVSQSSMICVGCKKPMAPGDVVVRAERAGLGKVWHPGCFKCDTCKVRADGALYKVTEQLIAYLALTHL